MVPKSKLVRLGFAASVCLLVRVPSAIPAAGSRLTQGSEMLHVWFTSDLRSAFAVHAPVPELCRDGLLTPKACRSGAHRREM